MDRLLTAQEVADYLHLHRNTVSRMVARGELHAYRVGTRGDMRFRLEEIVAWLTDRRT